MKELLFPIVGAALVVFVVLPVFSIVSKLLLSALGRLGGSGLLRFGAARYLLLLLPSFLAIAWTLSAGLHQAETGRAVLHCLVSHDLQELCVEPLLFVLVLSGILVLRAAPWLIAYRRASRIESDRSGEEAARVAAIIGERPELAPLRGRFAVNRAGVGGSATFGLFRPVVVLDAEFVRSCDDDTLVSVLAHELGHVRERDPLRYFLLSLAMQLNPFGYRLLRREAAAWFFQREVQCDRAAVLSGAKPFVLARALLQASRPAHPAVAHVRGGAAGKLRLRVELLLAYAERKPRDDSRHGASALALTLLVAVAAVAVPHVGATDPLDLLHTTVERLAAGVLN